MPMLEAARRKLGEAGMTGRVLLQNASAEELPCRAGVFDAVTIAFGIRNVVRRERALGEILRVLKPGGVGLFLDFSIPENRTVRVAYRFYFHRLLPLLGGMVSGDFRAYRYLPNSVEGFPKRGEFQEMLQDQGFREVKRWDFTLGIVTLYRGLRPV